MEERSGTHTVLWNAYNTYIDWSFAVLNTSSSRFDLIHEVSHDIALFCAHTAWCFVEVKAYRRTSSNTDRKWIAQQLQRVGITLSEEARGVDILAIDRTIELAEQEGFSKREAQRKENLFLVIEVLSQYFYSVVTCAVICRLEHLTDVLKRIVIAWRRLQYLAAQIHNRVACSPSPFRREPPIGGVKVGGSLPLSLCPYAA